MIRREVVPVLSRDLGVAQQPLVHRTLSHRLRKLSYRQDVFGDRQTIPICDLTDLAGIEVRLEELVFVQLRPGHANRHVRCFDDRSSDLLPGNLDFSPILELNLHGADVRPDHPADLTVYGDILALEVRFCVQGAFRQLLAGRLAGNCQFLRFEVPGQVADA